MGQIMKTEVDIKHDEYLKRRDELMKIRESSQDSFDKAILYLSTGGLVLSVTFLSEIGKPYDVFTYWLIDSVWFFLLLTTVLNVLSYYFAKRNMGDKLNKLDFSYRNKIEGDEEDSGYKKWVERCNDLSLLTFMMAFLLFVVFVSLIQMNLIKRGEMCYGRTKSSCQARSD